MHKTFAPDPTFPPPSLASSCAHLPLQAKTYDNLASTVRMLHELPASERAAKCPCLGLVQVRSTHTHRLNGLGVKPS